MAEWKQPGEACSGGAAGVQRFAPRATALPREAREGGDAFARKGPADAARPPAAVDP